MGVKNGRGSFWCLDRRFGIAGEHGKYEVERTRQNQAVVDKSHSFKPVTTAICSIAQFYCLYSTDLLPGAVGDTQSVGQRLSPGEHLLRVLEVQRVRRN